MIRALIAGWALVAASHGLARQQIQNKGSDTLVNVAQAWAEAYSQHQSKVVVAVSGGGSGTGIAAMMNGTVDIANSSRRIKPSEKARAEKKGGVPREHIVGYDALSVVVHPNSPIKALSLEQVARIYGRKNTAKTWSDLGFKIPGCPSDKIIAVNRQNSSGSRVYFQEAVMGKGGKFRLGTLDMHGSKEVVDLVAETPCAVGYSGLAYLTSHVKSVCISSGNKGTCVLPSVATAIDGTYPVARPLFMYTYGEPKGHVKDYLSWIQSPKAQCIIQRKGYAPVLKDACGDQKS